MEMEIVCLFIAAFRRKHLLTIVIGRKYAITTVIGKKNVFTAAFRIHM